MKNRKRTAFISAVIMILLVSALPLTAGYVNKDVKTEKIKIGFSLNYQENNMSYLADGIKDFFKEQSEIEIVILNANHDPAEQYYNVEYLIAEKVNAVVTFTGEENDAEITSVLCRKAGIPVKAAEYKAADSSESEAYAYGYKAAETVLELIISGK